MSLKPVDMSLFQPDATVDPGFHSFLQTFYTYAEDPSDEATAKFVSFFDADVKFVRGGATMFSGKDGAAIFKKVVAGGNQFNHFPRTGTVSAETDTTKTYAVDGSAKATAPDGTVEATNYTTRWTVKKSADGLPDLKPETDNIVQLDLVAKSPVPAGSDPFKKPVSVE